MPGKRDHAAQESQESKHGEHPIWWIEHLDNAVADVTEDRGDWLEWVAIRRCEVAEQRKRRRVKSTGEATVHIIASSC